MRIMGQECDSSGPDGHIHRGIMGGKWKKFICKPAQSGRQGKEILAEDLTDIVCEGHLSLFQHYCRYSVLKAGCSKWSVGHIAEKRLVLKGHCGALSFSPQCNVSPHLYSAKTLNSMKYTINKAHLKLQQTCSSSVV